MFCDAAAIQGHVVRHFCPETEVRHDAETMDHRCTNMVIASKV